MRSPISSFKWLPKSLNPIPFCIIPPQLELYTFIGIIAMSTADASMAPSNQPAFFASSERRVSTTSPSSVGPTSDRSRPSRRRPPPRGGGPLRRRSLPPRTPGPSATPCAMVFWFNRSRAARQAPSRPGAYATPKVRHGTAAGRWPKTPPGALANGRPGPCDPPKPRRARNYPLGVEMST